MHLKKTVLLRKIFNTLPGIFSAVALAGIYYVTKSLTNLDILTNLRNNEQPGRLTSEPSRFRLRFDIPKPAYSRELKDCSDKCLNKYQVFLDGYAEKIEACYKESPEGIWEKIRSFIKYRELEEEFVKEWPIHENECNSCQEVCKANYNLASSVKI